MAVLADLELLTTTAPTGNSTTPAPPYPVYTGYITALVAVLMYGSNFVPIKKFYTGDGMFFQFVLCNGIFLVGLIVQFIQNSTFYPMVVLGGFIWATGNLCVVPIFKTIGMGLGMSMWGIVALLSGWASGKFGLFGNKKDEIGNPTMNYIGVALAFISILIYLMVKNEVSAGTDVDVNVLSDSEEDPLLPARPQGAINNSQRSTPEQHPVVDILVFNKAVNDDKYSKAGRDSGEDEESDDKMWIEHLAPNMKKIIGFLLCVGSGIMYGVNFLPAIHIMQRTDGASQNGLDYVFAHFCGIYISSAVYFYIYCIFKKNRPKVYPRVIVPGIISGLMWGIATASWYIAIAELSQSITFPIVATGPAAIASLFWGVFIFHEIKGLRNICILIVAFCTMATGAILAGLSK